MWLVLVEYVLSLCWAYGFLFSLVLYALGKVVTMPEGLNVPTVAPPAFWGLLLATTNLMQIAVALSIEERYEPHLGRSAFWIIWYPMAFWAISFLTILFGFPKALFKRRTKRAVWTSPDRGFRSFSPPPHS